MVRISINSTDSLNDVDEILLWHRMGKTNFSYISQKVRMLRWNINHFIVGPFGNMCPLLGDDRQVFFFQCLRVIKYGQIGG